jgi:IclR family pca regulon transcriptional regulator
MQNRDIATTFAKGLQVLRVFDGTLTLAEVARRSGLDRAVTRRLVLTLMDQGYVYQDGRGYALTPKVLMLAGGFLQARQIGTRVQPALDRHAAALGSAITLAVRQDDQVLLIAQSTLQDSPVSFGFTMGSVLPLLHTALGRVLLGSAPALIPVAPMAAHTDQSLMDSTAIADQVTQAASQGYAVVDGEFERGIIGFAAPVGLQAAVGASAPRGLAGAPEVQDRFIRALQMCGSELAQSGGV